jgi:hypothetical protein
MMKIPTEQRRAMLDILQIIRDDLVDDVGELEGQPFNGRTFAAAFGGLAAQVDALAHMLQVILDDPEDQPGGEEIGTHRRVALAASEARYMQGRRPVEDVYLPEPKRTDWPTTAADLLSGDPERIEPHLPPEMRGPKRLAQRQVLAAAERHGWRVEPEDHRPEKWMVILPGEPLWLEIIWTGEEGFFTATLNDELTQVVLGGLPAVLDVLVRRA